MMQKSNEEIYKALSEAERNLAEKNVGWMDKASKRKENWQSILSTPFCYYYSSFLLFILAFQKILFSHQFYKVKSKSKKFSFIQKAKLPAAFYLRKSSASW